MNEITKEIRRNILKMVFSTSGSHIGCSLGIVEILTALYFNVLNIDPKHPDDPQRDRFVLSKGHACAALYAVLAERGFFPKTELAQYLMNGSRIAAHSTLGSLPGIEVTAGSLGHGLSMGAGMALAQLHNPTPERVFVLVGDGECLEGSVWEAIILAAQKKLYNLILIIDNNDLITLGNLSDIVSLSPIDKKLESFGWNVMIVDGHDIGELTAALKNPHEKPYAIIAKTIKGKGVSFMENKPEWHGKCPSKEQFEIALKELT